MSPQRVRYQGLKDASTLRRDIRYGEAERLRVRAGSTLSVTLVGGGVYVWLTARADDDQTFGVAAFEGISDTGDALPTTGYDNRPLREMAHNRDATLEHARGLRIFAGTDTGGDTHIGRITKDADLFCILPAQPDFLATGSGGSVTLVVQPLGHVVDEWRGSRGTAQAYQLKKGQFVQIIDVEGQQCSDFMAMRADALDQGIERYIDSTVSRTMARGAYPTPGLHDKFFDQDMTPLLAVRQDTV